MICRNNEGMLFILLDDNLEIGSIIYSTLTHFVNDSAIYKYWLHNM